MRLTSKSAPVYIYCIWEIKGTTMLTFFRACVVICVQSIPTTVPGYTAVLADVICDMMTVIWEIIIAITRSAFCLCREIQRHEHNWQNGKNGDCYRENDFFFWCRVMTISLAVVRCKSHQSKWRDTSRQILHIGKWRWNKFHSLWKWRRLLLSNFLFRIYHFAINKFWLLHP